MRNIWKMEDLNTLDCFHIEKRGENGGDVSKHD